MFDVDKEQIKRMAYFIYDWMRGIPVPTDIPVTPITYCMDALLKLLEKQEEVAEVYKKESELATMKCMDCIFARMEKAVKRE